MRNVSSKARSATYSPDGDFIACGFQGGGFIVFETATGNEVCAKKHRRETISCLRFSPDGRWLAVGSHDNFVDLYDTRRSYKRSGVCKGHSSYVTHLDWSEDGRFLQSNSGDYELLFWEVPKCQPVRFPSSMKDTRWDSWTCAVGWPVQGIWPKHAAGADVNATDRSKDGEVCAVADDHGLVKLFRYPSDVGRGEYRGYLGHAPGVSNVCFSHNDEFLITTGANDRCAFQWRHYETDEGEYFPITTFRLPVCPYETDTFLLISQGDEEMTSEVEEECLTAVEDYEDFAVSNQVVKMVVVGKSGGIPVYAPADALDAKVSISHPPQSASAIAQTRLTLSC